MLTYRQLAALRRAVAEAETWRGCLLGNPDPEPLAEFDAFIKTAKGALVEVKKLNDELRKRK